MIETDPDETSHAVDLSQEALEQARAMGDARTLAEVAMWVGFVQDSSSLGLEAVAAADASGDPTFATYIRLEAVRFCDYETCETLLRDAERLVERHHIDEYRATIAVSIAEAAARRGDSKSALAALERALEADEAAPLNHRLETRVYGAIILADEGGFDGADALLADGFGLLANTQTDVAMEREARAAARPRRAHARRPPFGAPSPRCSAIGSDRPYLFRTDGLALLALAASDRLDGHVDQAIASLLPLLEWTRPRGAEARAQAMEELAACLVDIDGAEEAARVLASADRLRRAEELPLAPARVADGRRVARRDRRDGARRGRGPRRRGAARPRPRARGPGRIALRRARLDAARPRPFRELLARVVLGDRPVLEPLLEQERQRLPRPSHRARCRGTPSPGARRAAGGSRASSSCSRSSAMRASSSSMRRESAAAFF